MKPKQFARSAAKLVAASAGVAVVSYAGHAGLTWLRYGHPSRARSSDADPLLDIFVPVYEVVERHAVHVAAPADITLSAAIGTELESSALVRAIFKGREWILRSKPDRLIRPRGLLAETRALGWGELAEMPGREIVMGAVTKPWEANPTFTAVAPDEFRAFQKPGFVKIAWTLRADALGSRESLFRTETRALATDSEARKKFRKYWSLLSPGIGLIRVVMLPAVKAEAERRWKRLAA